MVKNIGRNSRLPILIAVASGVPQQGKSTLILLLAGILGPLTGLKILVAELEENGKISRLRQKEISSEQAVPRTTYDIIQLVPAHFHATIIQYTAVYDLIFIEIPAIKELATYTDVFLVCQVILSPIVAMPENFAANQLFFEKLSKIQALKTARKLPSVLVGLFNKFKVGQDAGSYLAMSQLLNLNLLSSFLRFSLNYQIDLSSLEPVLPENSLEELILVAREFSALIKPADPSQ